jgi:hypothetical protein
MSDAQRVAGHEFIRQIKMAPAFAIMKDGSRHLVLHVRKNEDEMDTFLGPDFTAMEPVAVASFKEEVMETLRNPAIRENRLF